MTATQCNSNTGVFHAPASGVVHATSHEFTRVYDPHGVELFQMFDIVDSKGRSLFEMRPMQRSGVVDDFEAMSRQELIEKQNRERAARVEMMAAIVAEAEASETPLADMLVPAFWNRPQPEGATPPE